MINEVFEYLDKNTEIINKAIKQIPRASFTDLLKDCLSTLKDGGAIVASGLGKNVPICEKFVGTMWSLGLNAEFLHTNTAVHGDLGVVKAKDLVILITKSGSTSESIYLYNLLKDRVKKLWILSSNPEGVLSKASSKKLIVPLEHEGDKWDIVPNNSSTLYLLILQTIAIQMADELNVSLHDFKKNHPGGAIGERLKNE